MTRVAEKTGLERTHLYRRAGKQLGVEPVLRHPRNITERKDKRWNTSISGQAG